MSRRDRCPLPARADVGEPGLGDAVGRYVEFVDLTTGKTVGHKMYDK